MTRVARSEQDRPPPEREVVVVGDVAEGLDPERRVGDEAGLRVDAAPEPGVGREALERRQVVREVRRRRPVAEDPVTRGDLLRLVGREHPRGRAVARGEPLEDRRDAGRALEGLALGEENHRPQREPQVDDDESDQTRPEPPPPLAREGSSRRRQGGDQHAAWRESGDRGRPDDLARVALRHARAANARASIHAASGRANATETHPPTAATTRAERGSRPSGAAREPVSAPPRPPRAT